MTDDTVTVDREAVEFAADVLKEIARDAYADNATATADRYHGHARRLNDATDREWSEVGE